MITNGHVILGIRNQLGVNRIVIVTTNTLDKLKLKRINTGQPVYYSYF